MDSLPGVVSQELNDDVNSGGEDFGPPAPFDDGGVWQWIGGDVWVPTPITAGWVERAATMEKTTVTEADVQVTRWLGWDEDRAQPWGSDEDAALRLVDELGERGYRVEPDGGMVAVVKGSGRKKEVYRGSGRTLTEALVKAVLKVAA